MTAEEITVYVETWNRCSSVKEFHDITGLDREEIKWRTRRLRGRGCKLKLMGHGPTWYPKSKERGNCRHCDIHISSRPRHLCALCYKDPTIRKKYPKAIDQKDTMEDATMEELDAMIAERSKPENLPSWWNHDVKMEKLRGLIPKDDAYYYQLIRCTLNLNAPKRLAM